METSFTTNNVTQNQIQTEVVQKENLQIIPIPLKNNYSSDIKRNDTIKK